MKLRWISILLAAIALSAGCHHGKPQPGVATETEETLKQRWVAKRMGELQASGVNDPREARRQAVEEFRQKYKYAPSASKPDLVGGGQMP
jgi:1,2-phenylacetyl-CoA epoxidase catalytic subunit